MVVRRSAQASRRRLSAVAATALLWLACTGDGGGFDPGPLAGRAFVVNSISGTLSIVGRNPGDGGLVAQNDVVELGPDANAVTLAVGEGVVAVPTQANRLLVFEEGTLAQRCSAALPAGSSPLGVAIAGGRAYVSLLRSGQVARVDLAGCEVEQVAPVGPAPAGVVASGAALLVVVGNIDLSAFPPPRLGESYVAVMDPATLALLDTTGTGGFNAQFAALDREGDLLVVNSGDFGLGNSTISVLDPAAQRMTAGPFALGEFGGTVAVGPSNRAYVTSFNDGLYVFDASANRVVRGPENPLFAPGQAGERRGSGGVAVDRRGNVLSVFFGDFATPGKVFLFDDAEALVDSATVGIGPFGIELERSAQPD